MFKKVLIANRGEIARRIIRTLKPLGIPAVSVYDDREKHASYVKESDESYSLGSGNIADTFLNAGKIFRIARDSECEAIHPGYGFLSEDAGFSRRCREEGMVFIGPPPEVIEIIGNKQTAIDIAGKLGVPVVPGIRGTVDHILNNMHEDLFPVLIKPVAGGGGKAMAKIHDPVSMEQALRRISGESARYFANPELYVEKYINNARHIEVQMLGDLYGSVTHLYERECSIQRRFQKVIEETPAPGLDDKIRRAVLRDAVKIASAVNYKGAGTVEFLLDEYGTHFFLEMNTRIQVEHGITELVTGTDIVAAQLRIAGGEKISSVLPEMKINGHAIEARIYSEDPRADYRPSSGKVSLAYFPEDDGVRIDHDLKTNAFIHNEFDPLQAKIMAHGKNRPEAIAKLRSALSRTVIHGVTTNLDLLYAITNDDLFRKGKYNTSFLNESQRKLKYPEKLPAEERNMLITAGTFLTLFELPGVPGNGYENGSYTPVGYWRIDKKINVLFNGKEYDIHLIRTDKNVLSLQTGKRRFQLEVINLMPGIFYCQINHKKYKIHFSWNTEDLCLNIGFDYRCNHLIRSDFLISKKAFVQRTDDEQNKPIDTIYAPLNGKIIRINCRSEQILTKGEQLLTIESMKMENDICIPVNGKIESVYSNVGDQVSKGQKLIGISESRG
ncbi:MAG: biotin carboxylase N-terminal domain-containing protein [Bacteroidales bacterium]|jgi:acetyl/propionyl-CoA carboxylase alpha subunit